MRNLIPLCAGILAVVLLIVDNWPALAGTPQPDEWIDDLERVLCDGGEGQREE